MTGQDDRQTVSRGAMRPRVSVIVPYCDAADTIGATVGSLVKSDYDNFEIICVNDFSKDGSETRIMGFDVRHVALIRRSGAAVARNLGASMATGDFLFFVDADVEVRPDTLATVVKTFSTSPNIAASLGAYTPHPTTSNFAGVYKNLVHHFTHLTSNPSAHTFWSGCGAIRTLVFRTMNGFDESYAASSVEDIELGYRLSAAGYEILLNKELLVSHAKVYTLRSLIRSDLMDRAIPWTLLMARKGVFYADLNLRASNVASALVLILVFPFGVASIFYLPLGYSLLAMAAALAAYLALNRAIFAFVRREMGVGFLVKFIPMYTLTYLYSAVGFAMGLVLFLLEKLRALSRRRNRPTPPAGVSS